LGRVSSANPSLKFLSFFLNRRERRETKAKETKELKGF